MFLMRIVAAAAILVSSATFCQEPARSGGNTPALIPRNELLQDVRQLQTILETAHPDPYVRGGGKIAFHRRLQEVLNAIPPEGLTQYDFFRLLRPFVAAVGDAHTRIMTYMNIDYVRPGGVPLDFGVVEGSLYVSGVPSSLDSALIGARLLALEGVSLHRYHGTRPQDVCRGE